MPVQTQPVAITLQDGSLAVMNLILNDGRGIVQTADAATIDREISRTSLPSPAVSWRLITPAELPSTRRWRNCWRDRGSVTVDMELARAQRLSELRAERDAALVATDPDYLRAQERDDAVEVARLKALRQALRDMPSRVTPLLSAASVPDDLEAIILTEDTRR